MKGAIKGVGREDEGVRKHSVCNKRLCVITPAFSVTCIGNIYQQLPSLDMLCKWLKGCLTLKLAIFPGLWWK